MGYKTILESEEFNVLHDKADLVVVVVGVFLTIIFIRLLRLWLIVIYEILHLIIVMNALIIQKISQLQGLISVIIVIYILALVIVVKDRRLALLLLLPYIIRSYIVHIIKLVLLAENLFVVGVHI